MSKHDKYILITWYKDEMSDQRSNWSFETEFNFIKSEELDNISELMKKYRVTQWVKNPERVTEETWGYGDGCLIEYRNLTVKPIRIVESWKITSEVNS